MISVGLIFFIIIFLMIGVLIGVSLQGQSTQTDEIGHIVFPNKTTITVEIADDRSEQTLGLSDRQELEDRRGLLFLYQEKHIPSYWMKDMRFPIDIIWIDGVTVVGFEEFLQPEDPPTTLYSPKAPVDKVLEVSAGFVRENSLNIGDILDIQI